MAVPKDIIPSLSEIQCKICEEILIEPVTLPCNHTVCKACFQLIIEKSNLCCPFCRRRISSWVRYHTPRNSLVNMEMWEKIQKHYPKECKLRISCQESEESIDDFQPVRQLSERGELRREYEEELSKVESERRANQEKENKASEEYIQKLLAEELSKVESERRANQEKENKASEEYIQKLLAEEEEEEKRQEEKRRRDMEEQLKSDEELARKISININDTCEDSVLASPGSSRKSDPVTTSSQEKRKSKETDTGDIQEYLSPKSQFEPARRTRKQ